MIIFQRVVTFEGPQQDVVPWAMEITKAVDDKTELNPSLWQGLFGGPIGTMAWSTLVPSLTILQSEMDKLGQDPGFIDLLSKAQDWVTAPGQDFLLRTAHVAGGDYVRPDVGAYAEGTSAVPAEGKLARAAQFGVEISDLHSQLTHASVLFCTNEYGPFGEMRWLALYDSAASLDNASDAIAKDADYAAKLDSAGELFVEGMAQRTLARRIA